MDDDEVLSMLGGSRLYNAGSSRPPCPPRGQNSEFDRYFARTTTDIDPDQTDMDELRRAAWATWKVQPPAALGRNNPADADEDDELARALALSVQEHSSSSTRPSSRPIVISDDEEDDELQKAIALSQQEAREPKRQKREETPEEERRMLAEAMAASLAEAEPSTKPPSADLSTKKKAAPPSIVVAPAEVSPAPPTSSSTDSASSLLRVGGQVLDRAQLERERRERQAAREAANGTKSANGTNGTKSTSGNPIVSIAGPSRIAGMSSLPSSSASAATSSAHSTSSFITSSSSRHPLQSSGPFPSDAGGEYYPDGEMRHVALTIGNPTKERTFSPQQVIGNHSAISLVIMSSFCIDDQWIGEKEILPSPDAVPTIIIRPHPRDKPDHNGKVQLQTNGEMWVYPKMIGEWGSAHMKYFWIFYKTGRLRVVILTANMVPYDWEWIENTVFVQDFLPLQSPIPFRPNHLPHDFPQQFRTLFGHLRVHSALRHLTSHHPYGSRIPFKPEDGFASMTKWDWSRVKVRIVMSVPGTYAGSGQVDKYGMCRLGRVLSDEGWMPRAGEKVVAEFQGSSLGQYGMDWYDKFYQFTSGKSAQSLVGRPKATSWPSLKIVFPSLATVDASELGRGGGGTMFAAKAFNKVTQHLFHDSNSKRGGVLMHAKLLVAIFEPATDHLGFKANTTSQSSSASSPKSNGKRKASELEEADKMQVGGWIYVGSHNFSSAAWGTLDLKKNPPSLNVRNYELGIVFPLDRKNASAIADKVVPYRRPVRQYGPGDVPWDQNAHLPTS